MSPKSPPKGENPDQFSIPGGGTASGNQVADIYQRLGGIERSIAYIEVGKDGTDKKIDDLRDRLNALVSEFGEAKASFNATKPIIKGMGIAMWAIAGGIGVFLLGILTLRIKHHFGW